MSNGNGILRGKPRRRALRRVGCRLLKRRNTPLEQSRRIGGQKSFKYSLSKFMQVRGAETIIAQGKRRLNKNPSLYANLEAQYGVPAGVLIAIHGMETGFGGFMGDSSVVAAISTLAYDCRRTEFFQPHALAALKLVDQGVITGNTKGAKHGELGHTQFPARQCAALWRRWQRRRSG